jgi:prophage regulatory protein
MKFLRIRDVTELTGLSRMTIYRMEVAGEFPRRRQIGKNSVAWLEADLTRWAKSRPVAPLKSGGANPGVRGESFELFTR